MLLRRMFTWLFGEAQSGAQGGQQNSSEAGSTVDQQAESIAIAEEIAESARAVAQSAVEVEEAARDASEAMAEAAKTVREIDALEALENATFTPAEELDDAPLRGPMKHAKSDAHPRDEWVRNERRSKSQKRKNARSKTDRCLRKRRDAQREKELARS